MVFLKKYTSHAKRIKFLAILVLSLSAITIVVFIHPSFPAGPIPSESNIYRISKSPLNKTHSISTIYRFSKSPLNKTPSIAKDASFLHWSNNHRTVPQHPIQTLMEAAETQYQKKLMSQSMTLESAIKEYKRRYHLNPPRGFDQWFEFAQKNDVVMIDEYDGLMQDLEPFWQISGEELRRRSAHAAQLPSIDLVRIKNGTAEVVDTLKENAEAHARGRGFAKMLKHFVQKLPDMEFPVNANAEGRVLVPWEQRKQPNITNQDSSGDIEHIPSSLFKRGWDNEGNVWEAWRRTCEPQSPARRLYASVRNSLNPAAVNYFGHTEDGPGRDFKFVNATSVQLDFCSRPHAHYMQGHFFSDWRTIPLLYPVFSPAKAKGFLDIRIPSHYYYGSTPMYTYGWDPVKSQLKDVDPMEVPWEEKMDKIFWRGATTGGGSHPPGFSPSYQRHRFLRMASNTTDIDRFVIYADPTSNSTNFVATQIAVSKLNEEIMDVAFTKALNTEAYPGGLEALRTQHRFVDPVPLGRHWSYRYLVDLDGMSYSGRFMAFLASDSVPIKSTVYAEFFTDWIQPWVHFIPLSTSYKEIYNIYGYFTGPTNATLEAANLTLPEVPIEQRRTKEGDERLRSIALAGKRWKKTIGRPVDMEAYVYRLCLEWARLWAVDRVASSLAE